MAKLKKILHKLLFPGTAVVLFSVLIGAALLVYTFLAAGAHSPIAYLVYAVSAYALAVACASLFLFFRRGARQWAHKQPLLHRYVTDAPFKLQVSLHLSFAVNLLYAAINAFSGLYYRSPWFGSLAAYYICLALMRFSLVRYAHRPGCERSKSAEWRCYRLCGALLTGMNVALAGVVILVIQKNERFEYAGFLIYMMAAYTFYITILAIVNVLRYRKYQSPVMSAAKAVSLAAALVSMLSLETAMLAQFGQADKAVFRQIMTGATGGAVCLFVVSMGIYMVAHATKQLKNNHSATQV